MLTPLTSRELLKSGSWADRFGRTLGDTTAIPDIDRDVALLADDHRGAMPLAELQFPPASALMSGAPGGPLLSEEVHERAHRQIGAGWPDADARHLCFSETSRELQAGRRNLRGFQKSRALAECSLLVLRETPWPTHIGDITRLSGLLTEHPLKGAETAAVDVAVGCLTAC